MFGSDILDVGIGLVFVYLLVSMICSAVREGIEGWMKTRATYLEHGIRLLLQDKSGEGLARTFFQHPLIFGLFSAEKYVPGPNTSRPSLLTRGVGRPSYIPSRNFALALMDIAARGPNFNDPDSDQTAHPISLDSVRRNLSNIQSPAIQRILLLAIDSAQGDLDKATANVEAWFDSGMDRVSGWYKRSTQLIILIIGLTLAVSMNIDTIKIVNHLYSSKGARELAVATAQSARSDATYAEAKGEIQKLDLPIGWTGTSRPTALSSSLLGWILTAIAATLGAPFWFDLLNKIMVIRSTVKPHEKSREEGSEDRQEPTENKPIAGPPALTAAKIPIGSATPPSLNAVDSENDIDGCSLDFTAVGDTSDEQLPGAEGGVS